MKFYYSPGPACTAYLNSDKNFFIIQIKERIKCAFYAFLSNFNVLQILTYYVQNSRKYISVAKV